MLLSKLLSERPETQAELAAKAGVFQTTVGNWRRGVSLPPSTRIAALAAAIEMDVEALKALVARDRSARARRHGSRRTSRGRA